MLCPNFTSNDSVLLLVQPSSPPVFSLSLSPLLNFTQAPNAKPQNSSPLLCLPSPLPGCTLDRCQPLLLSPTSLTPDLPPFAPLFSNPLPQLMQTLNSFKSVPPLPSPTNNAPSPCTFPNFLFSLHPSSPFLCSLNPSPPPPSPPFSPPPHLVVSLQVNLARCVADVSSSPVAGRWWWRLRR